MNKKAKKVKVASLQRKWHEAYMLWHNELMFLIQSYGGELKIEDENEGPYEDEDDYSKRIYTQDETHSYVYAPRFDRVKVDEDINGKQLYFHVKNGDGMFADDTWVNEHGFADTNWLELVDWIQFPDE